MDKVITKFTTSNAGKKFCNYVTNPKNEKFLNSTLPVAQQATAEVVGIGITVFSPQMEHEQKKSQLINHGLKAATNLTLVAGASTATATFAQKVAENLDKKGISKGVQTGVKVGFPLLTAVLLSRYLIPVLLNPISSKLRDVYNDKFCKGKKDVKKEPSHVEPKKDNLIRNKFEERLKENENTVDRENKKIVSYLNVLA